MAGNTKDINLRARLKGSQKVGKGLGRIDKGLKKVAASAIATVGAFMGARMLYDGMKSVINAAKEQELQERKLAAVIKSSKTDLFSFNVSSEISIFCIMPSPSRITFTELAPDIPSTLIFLIFYLLSLIFA